ncbi:dTDP-4-dehydrorhamnose reductase [Henriciella sp.]|uniref:dTDP-4-dehydrorhamnose reductase n=1 Tax=Henriciella sp. TaxID=1968823 RepID=UPI00262686B1|nr:dTDP-4-dehydrorhamnose reductase [Henriciella sp.]
MTQDILVTGGNGRLGMALARQGCRALPRDRMDITDPVQLASVLEQRQPSCVINAAAYTAVDHAEDESDNAHRVNAAGAGLLARLCAAASIPLIQISTDMVFSKADPDSPLPEKTWPEPDSVYGASKLEGETLVRQAGGPHLIARVSWLFDREGESFVSKILGAGLQRDTLKLVEDEHGRPTPADDLAAKLIILAGYLERGDPLPPVLHLGPPVPVSRYGWAQHIFETAERLGHRVPTLEPVSSSQFKTPANRPLGVVLDVSLADSLLGPMPDWKPSCEEVVRHALDSWAS